MFDDFKQDKTEKEIDSLSSSPLPLNKKLALAIAASSILFFFVWYSFDSSSTEKPRANQTLELAELTKRVESLEQALHKIDHATSSITADKELGNSFLSFTQEAISTYNDPYAQPSTNQEDAAFSQSSPTQNSPISVTESLSTPPKEIAIELSSLFEKEIALSSSTQSQSYDSPATATPEPSQPSAPKASSKPKNTPSTPASKRTYTVQKGDTLSKISLKFYGSSNKWKKIADANKEKLGNSQVLKSGMTLTIPEE